jgi:predicted secreted hydrolase
VNRRDFVFAGLAFPLVVPDYKLQFPRDHGAHPDYRQEWWYVTGWLKTERGEDLGFQITFFRARPDLSSENPSSFTPRQLILAHAAISDPRHGRLRHDERAARTALGLAGSEQGTTRVWVDDWMLDMQKDFYQARIRAKDFSFDLQFETKQAPLLQGVQGFSRKGNSPEEASYYYSRPQLQVSGSANGSKVTGTAWLDHEWSSQYMAAGSTGWDWCGINLDDGGALMAFRMRDKEGRKLFASPDVDFEVRKTWKSPRTGTSYPVSMAVKAKGDEILLEPLMDDQELDARASTGTIYWEGAVRALRAGKQVGRGYLELTGYWRPMKL